MAGWSFAEEPIAVPFQPLAGYVIEVTANRNGLRIGSRLVTPRSFASLVAALRPTGSVIIILDGPALPDASRDMLAGAISDALGRRVTVPAGQPRFAANGLLHTNGTFLRFHPRRAGADRRIDALGAVLPPFGSEPVAMPVSPGSSKSVAHPVDAPVSPILSQPVAASVLSPVRPPERVAAETIAPITVDWSRLLSATREGRPTVAGLDPLIPALPPVPIGPPAIEEVQPPLSRPTVEGPLRALLAEAEDLAETIAPPGPAPGTAPHPGWSESGLWLPDADPTPERADANRAALRTALSGRYDMHARVVTRALSENPGLRAVSGTVGGITAGLVAVRSYLLDENETVNRVLRGSPGDTDRVTLIAGSARYGLRRMPSVFGPVFRGRPGEPGETIAAYQPGDELIEPGFVDVSLTPSGADTAIEYAIWSVSAHRLNGLDVDDDAALFPPGTRFAVLAVDRQADGPLRVLLRDLASRRQARAGAAESTERVLAGLRAAPRPAPVIRPPGPRMAFPIGLDHAGRRFRRPAVPPSAGLAPARATPTISRESGRA